MSQGSLEARSTIIDTRSTRDPEPTTEEPPTIDPDGLLELLADEHARSILKTISDEALPAREIANRINVSRATVYRRLNRLTDAGIVEASMVYRSDGRHRQRFHMVLDELKLAFNDGDVTVADVT